MVPDGDNVVIKLQEMKNEKGEAIDSTPVATMIYTIKCSKELKAGDMLIKSKVDLQQ
jgi:putative protease